jgi:hypothetical protein
MLVTTQQQHYIHNTKAHFLLTVLLTVNRNIYQYNTTNNALFAFSLLRLIASTCFEDLFAHHQEALYIQLVYFVRIISAGC